MIDIKTIAALFLTLSSCSMGLTTIDNPEVYSTREFGFSQAVVFNHVMYSSGQVGLEKGFKLSTAGGFDNQLDLALKNIEHILSHKKSDWQDVIHLRFYVVNLDASKRDKVSRFLKETYPSGYAPSTTLLGVQALAREGLLVEIEFTAKIK